MGLRIRFLVSTRSVFRTDCLFQYRAQRWCAPEIRRPLSALHGRSDSMERDSHRPTLRCRSNAYLMTLYFLRIWRVLSMGRASTVRPRPVVVFALNSEL